MSDDEKKGKPIKVKIISGDKPYSTRVLDAETGQHLAYATKINISISKNTSFMPKATIEFHGTPLDLVADLEFAHVTCPTCQAKMVLTGEQVKTHMKARGRHRE